MEARDREVIVKPHQAFVVRVSRGHDLPVRLQGDGHRAGAVVDYHAADPVAVEGRVQRTVGVKPRDTEVAVIVQRDNYFSVALKREAVGAVYVNELKETALPERSVDAPVGVQPREDRRPVGIVSPVTGKHHLCVRLDRHVFDDEVGPGEVDDGPAVAVERRVEVAGAQERPGFE
jgi:hypothetical protein